MGTTEATPRDSNRREFTRVEVELVVRLKVDGEWFLSAVSFSSDAPAPVPVVRP